MFTYVLSAVLSFLTTSVRQPLTAASPAARSAGAGTVGGGQGRRAGARGSRQGAARAAEDVSNAGAVWRPFRPRTHKPANARVRFSAWHAIVVQLFCVQLSATVLQPLGVGLCFEARDCSTAGEAPRNLPLHYVCRLREQPGFSKQHVLRQPYSNAFTSFVLRLEREPSHGFRPGRWSM